MFFLLTKHAPDTPPPRFLTNVNKKMFFLMKASLTIDGVEHTDLETVLNFIYLGKVFVCGVCWSFQFMDNIKKEIFEFNAFLEFASNVDPRLSDGEMLFYLHPSRNIYSLSLTEKFITFYQNTLENMLEERFLNLIIYPSILQSNLNAYVTF